MKRILLIICLLLPVSVCAANKLDSDSDGAIDLSVGGLGNSLTPPGADRVLFWDETGGDVSWLQLDSDFLFSGTVVSINEAGTFAWTGEHTFSNNVNLPSDITIGADLTITEQADHSSTPAAGYGYLWVRSDTPSALIFTDDAGTDFNLTNISSGDAVSIDGVGVTDPDFVSTGDIDFVDTANTVTANLNDNSVDANHISTFTLSPIVLAEPDTLQGISDAWPLYHFIAETYPSGVTITSIHITTSSTCTDVLNFEEWSNDGSTWSTDATVENITLSGVHTEDDGILADANVAADSWLYIDLDDSPTDINYMSITISFTSQ